MSHTFRGSHIKGAALGRGGSGDEAPVEFVNASHRYKTMVNNFVTGSDVSVGAVGAAGVTLWRTAVGGSVTDSITILAPDAVPYRGEGCAEFVGATAQNQGALWVQGLPHGSGFVGGSALLRTEPKRVWWYCELATANALANGSFAVGIMDMNTPPLDATGALVADPKMCGFHIRNTGEIRVIHGLVTNFAAGFAAANVPVRLAIAHTSFGVQLSQVYQPQSVVEFYVNGELVLTENPAALGIIEEVNQSPGLCSVRLSLVNPWRVRVSHWAFASNVVAE